jgi:hypothetical protein
VRLLVGATVRVSHQRMPIAAISVGEQRVKGSAGRRDSAEVARLPRSPFVVTASVRSPLGLGHREAGAPCDQSTVRFCALRRYQQISDSKTRA